MWLVVDSIILERRLGIVELCRYLLCFPLHLVLISLKGKFVHYLQIVFQNSQKIEPKSIKLAIANAANMPTPAPGCPFPRGKIMECIPSKLEAR